MQSRYQKKVDYYFNDPRFKSLPPNLRRFPIGFKIARKLGFMPPPPVFCGFGYMLISNVGALPGIIFIVVGANYFTVITELPILPPLLGIIFGRFIDNVISLGKIPRYLGAETWDIYPGDHMENQK